MSIKNLSNYLIDCLEDASQAQLPSSTIPNFSLSDAYRIALEIKEIRQGKREKAIGKVFYQVCELDQALVNP